MAPVAILTRGQQQFASTLAARTGLNPRVIGSWLLAEESSGAAAGYEKRGYHNWLNIAITDSGPRGGSRSRVWANPVSAANATAEWLRGRGPIAKEYGAPAAGIRAILRSAGASPQSQIQAIVSSPWASSHYGGGSTLRQLYSQLSGVKLPAPGSSPGTGGEGASFVPGGPLVASRGTTGGSDATMEALGQVLQAVKSMSGPQVVASGASPARPAHAAGPRLPSGSRQAPPITPVSQQPNLAKLVEQAIGTAGPSVQSTVSQPRAPQVLEGQAPAGGAANPKGVVDFGGHKVAAWIAEALRYVESKGVKPEVESGYRTYAEQKRIYDSGVRPAAKPGTSKHEFTDFPGGAVDIRNAQQVARVLERSPYRHKLVWAGRKDPPHFSHPHGGSY